MPSREALHFDDKKRERLQACRTDDLRAAVDRRLSGFLPLRPGSRKTTTRRPEAVRELYSDPTLYVHRRGEGPSPEGEGEVLEVVTRRRRESSVRTKLSCCPRRESSLSPPS